MPGAFRSQSVACAKLGSPFMARLMGLCADRLRGGSVVSDHVLGWSGDPRPQSDNVPLRLAAAHHALRIEELALEGVYPPQEVDDETLWAAVESTLLRFPKRIVLWLQSAPQTNEVLRAAVILPALALIEERFRRPSDPSCACAYRGAF